MINPGNFFVITHGRRYVSDIFDAPTYSSAIVVQHLSAARQYASKKEALRDRDKLRKRAEEAGNKKPIEVYEINVKLV